MIYLVVAVVILGILAMRRNSFVFRSISLVVAIIACCFLTYLDMTITTTKQKRDKTGHLNVYLGRPYEDLCRHLAKLSEEDPGELKKTVLALTQDKNVAIIYETWLGCNNKDYYSFVQQLILRSVKTNQVINVSRKNE